MTRFNIVCGTAIVPLLARLVLCAAFVTAGWDKLMNVHEYTGEAAERLINLGVADLVERRPAARAASLAASMPLVPSRAWQDAPQDQPASDEPAVEDEPVEDQPIEDHDDEPPIPEPPPDVIVEDPVTGERTLVAKRLYGVALPLMDHGVDGRWSIRLAWLLVITELVGGALLLIGLFSRVWAVALAIAMVFAFYLTSLEPFMEQGGPFGLAADIPAFNRTYAQLGLLVLALTVALVGPGPVSLDRLIFRPAKVESEDEYA